MNNAQRAIGACGSLGVLFTGLKLTGFIFWPWWVIVLVFLAPIIIMFTIIGVMLLLFLLFGDE